MTSRNISHGYYLLLIVRHPLIWTVHSSQRKKVHAVTRFLYLYQWLL